VMIAVRGWFGVIRRGSVPKVSRYHRMFEFLRGEREDYGRSKSGELCRSNKGCEGYRLHTVAPGSERLSTEGPLFVQPLAQFATEFGRRKSRQLASAIKGPSGPCGVVAHGVFSAVQAHASGSGALFDFFRTLL